MLWKKLKVRTPPWAFCEDAALSVLSSQKDYYVAQVVSIFLRGERGISENKFGSPRSLVIIHPNKILFAKLDQLLLIVVNLHIKHSKTKTKKPNGTKVTYFDETRQVWRGVCHLSWLEGGYCVPFN